MVPVLDALKAWRKSIPALNGIDFRHVMDRETKVAAYPRSILSLKEKESNLPVMVECEVLEKITIEAINQNRLGDLPTVIALLRSKLDGKIPAPTDAARIHAHVYKIERADLTNLLTATITWTVLASWRRT